MRKHGKNTTALCTGICGSTVKPCSADGSFPCGKPLGQKGAGHAGQQIATAAARETGTTGGVIPTPAVWVGNQAAMSFEKNYTAGQPGEGEGVILSCMLNMVGRTTA